MFRRNKQLATLIYWTLFRKHCCIFFLILDELARVMFPLKAFVDARTSLGKSQSNWLYFRCLFGFFFRKIAIASPVLDYTSGRPAVFFFFDIQFIRDPSTHTVSSHALKNASISFVKKAKDQRRQAICKKNQNAIGDCRDLGIWLELRVGEILLCSKEYSSM